MAANIQQKTIVIHDYFLQKLINSGRVVTELT